jgi:hypothetical protein
VTGAGGVGGCFFECGDEGAAITHAEGVRFRRRAKLAQAGRRKGFLDKIKEF